MMMLRSRSLTFSLGALLGACTPAWQVQTEYPRETDFSSLQTWNWASPPGDKQTLTAARTADRLHLDDLIRSTIQRELGAKGFRQRSGRPDFRVAWSFGEWRHETGRLPGGGYGSAGLAFPGRHAVAERISPDGRALPPSLDPYSSAYEQARLAIQIIDSSSKQVVWHGWVMDNRDFGYFAVEQTREISAAIRDILKGFPPAR